MLRYSFYVIGGAYALQFFPRLPSAAAVFLCLPAAIICGCCPRLRWVLWVFAGGGCMWFAATLEMAGRLDPSLQGNDLTITAQIIDFPKLRGDSVRLVVGPLEPGGLPGRVLLSWYGPAALPALGDTWRLRVRLRRPRGFANPGGFDYSGWLHRNGIGATGYVLPHSGNGLQRDAPVDRQSTRRRRVNQRIDRLFPATDARAVLKAITVGARGEIADRQWRLYAQTGTSHLMAISGLHIGLAAGAAFALTWVLVAPCCPRGNIRNVALFVAAVAALSYAELSGFAVPARRAFLMALLVACAIALRRRVTPPHVLGCACLAIALSDPLSLRGPGFMLSFSAVALLLWSARMFVRSPLAANSRPVSRACTAVWGLIQVQLVLLFGLLPLTAALFGRVAWVAPIMNLLVLPVFNFVTVPAGLLGLVLGGAAAGVGDALLGLSYQSIDGVLRLLDAASRWLPIDLRLHVGGFWALAAVVATLLWAMAPPGWPGRQLSVVALIAALLHKPPPPPPACVAVRILDVGQGLSVVLRTRTRTLLYDTGPAFRSGTGTAQLVVEPYLRARGIAAIDTLLVSHSDLDHAGGVHWLSGALPIGRIVSGEPAVTGGAACADTADWQWDGVGFRLLHPRTAGRWQGNNASCVLEVQAGEHKLLIPGDIEASAERVLMAGNRLGPVDLVVVPHHGSRTSSAAGFVNALQPRFAVVSAGFGNRWGFPKQDIVNRWASAGATVLTTSSAGAIGLQYCAGDEAPAPRLERQHARRYWQD